MDVTASFLQKCISDKDIVDVWPKNGYHFFVQNVWPFCYSLSHQRYQKFWFHGWFLPLSLWVLLVAIAIFICDITVGIVWIAFLPCNNSNLLKEVVSVIIASYWSCFFSAAVSLGVAGWLMLLMPTTHTVTFQPVFIPIIPWTWNEPPFNPCASTCNVSLLFMAMQTP